MFVHENINFSIIASLLGLGLGYFCFGIEIWHLFAQSSIVYLMLHFIPPKHSYLAVFIFCMAYISASKLILYQNKDKFVCH
jgi:hypothetical protein